MASIFCAVRGFMERQMSRFIPMMTANKRMVLKLTRSRRRVGAHCPVGPHRGLSAEAGCCDAASRFLFMHNIQKIVWPREKKLGPRISWAELGVHACLAAYRNPN